MVQLAIEHMIDMASRRNEQKGINQSICTSGYNSFAFRSSSYKVSSSYKDAVLEDRGRARRKMRCNKRHTKDTEAEEEE